MADRNNAVAKPVWMKQAEEAKLKSEAKKAAAVKAVFEAMSKYVEKKREKEQASLDSKCEDAEDIANKPIGPVDPTKCMAAGVGIARGFTFLTKGGFTFLTKDADGRKVPNHGAQINVKVVRVGVGGTEQEGIAKDMGDRTDTVTYVVPKRGNYMDHIECNEKAIMGSPFPVFFSGGTFPGGKEGRIDIIRSDDDLPTGAIRGDRIGRLIVSTTVIGLGSNGTTVFEGFYDDRPVAVKQLVKGHQDIASDEIDILMKADRHPNIVQYYGKESDDDFKFLAMERCDYTLYDLIKKYSDFSYNSDFPNDPSYIYKSDSLRASMPDVKLWRADGHPSPLLLKLMRDMVSGLDCLHNLRIIHRDLKPTNVLITENWQLVAQLSDMAIRKRFFEDSGILGQQAPELLRDGGRETRAMDLFSLGCVLFFCVTRGRHPFGGPLERGYNTVKNQMNRSLVEFIPEAEDFFLHLLDPDPKLRPKASEVLLHPFFWSSDTRLSFLCQMSTKVQSEKNNNPGSDLLKELDSKAPLVLVRDWNLEIDTLFMDDIAKRPYNYSCVRDLLRAVQNKWIHRDQLSEEIKELLRPFPDGFYGYVAAKFPRLLIESYKVVSQFCREDEGFREYFTREM